jgi:hypothetical protein
MATPTLETLSVEQWAVLRQLDRFVRVDLKFDARELCYWYLLRFAIARNFNVEETKKMLTQFVQFQRKLATDKVGQWSPAAADFQEMRANINMGLHFTSNNGTPILIWRLGESKIKELLKTYTVEQVVYYFVQLGNRFMTIVLPMTSQLNQKRTEKLTVIFDLKNTDMMGFLSGKLNEFLKTFAEVGQVFYPNILEKLFMINAPMLFSAVWAVFKHFLHPTTQERIEISSGFNKEKIHAAVHPDRLPVWLGGNSTAPLIDNMGPWKAALEESYAAGSFYLKDNTPYEDYYYTKEERKSMEKTMIVAGPVVGIPETRIFSYQDLEDLSDNIQIRPLKTTKMVVSMAKANVTD